MLVDEPRPPCDVITPCIVSRRVSCHAVYRVTPCRFTPFEVMAQVVPLSSYAIVV